GANGHAISLVCADEYKDLLGIERLIQQAIPRQIVEGFKPVNPLGESKKEQPALKQKRPKKPKKKQMQDSGSPHRDNAPLKEKAAHTAKRSHPRSAQRRQQKIPLNA